MEQESSLKRVESVLSLTVDRAAALHGKLEEILFRAQRLSNAMKNGLKNSDYMFGYDLQHFRSEVRAFGLELASIPNMIGRLEHGAVYEEAAVGRARAVMRLTERLSRSLHGFQDMALLAQSHIREAEHKIEAWHMVQDVDQMVQKARPLPMIANKVLIRISTPDGPKGPPPSSAA
ncbi:MAG: hypothetical protein KGI84_07565 [Elusimicrobia bacterium]|nr:hypothetical protein [Elusimicrobiota bacterium]